MHESAEIRVRHLFSSRRLIILVLLFSNIVINYVDRVNLSVAGTLVARDFGWDATRMGVLYSASVWTYAIALIPCGWWADRFGSRPISAVGISVWSLGAMA
jgi:MFS transporter, ACS family, D-galactonate transporter